MPRLSDSMEEGTVLKWLKSVGDEVAVGDELVEIETDKANMVYESDLAGTLVEILAQEGDTLPVGDPIARVGDASEVSDAGGGAGAASSAAEESGAGAQQLGPAPVTEGSLKPQLEPAIEPRAASAPPPTPDSRLRRPRRPLRRQVPATGGSGLADREADREGAGARSAWVERVRPWWAHRQGRRRAGPGRRSRRAGPGGRAPGTRRAAGGPRRTGRSDPGVAEKPETAKAGRGGGAHQAPADRRPPNGRVEGDRAALLPAGRVRHDRRGRGPRQAQGDGEGGRAGPHLQRHGRKRARSRCASIPGRTAPIATGGSSSTRG